MRKTNYDCTRCGQDLRLPPIDPRQYRALILIASLARREHGPNVCKKSCRVCKAYARLGPLSDLKETRAAPAPTTEDRSDE